jgi:hypothetical protein
MERTLRQPAPLSLVADMKTFFDKLHHERDDLYAESADLTINSDDNALDGHGSNVSISTEFDLLAVQNNGTSVSGVTSAQVASAVVGGIVGLAALLGAGLGFWRYAANKNTRKGEQFADEIRIALNLKGLDTLGPSKKAMLFRTS